MKILVVCLTLVLLACGGEEPTAERCPPGSTDPACNPALDRDGDGVPDGVDNCPDAVNPGQADADNDGVGDACEDAPPPPPPPGPDGDGDGVPDSSDNCPQLKNADQQDHDSDGTGDACTVQDGTRDHPFIISVDAPHFVQTIQRDTTGSPSDVVDSYPPSTVDESGPEHFYAFRLTQASRVTAEVRAPEPTGVDIDVHLLRSLSPVDLVERNNLVVYGALQPGDRVRLRRRVLRRGDGGRSGPLTRHGRPQGQLLQPLVGPHVLQLEGQVRTSSGSSCPSDGQNAFTRGS